MPRTLIAAGYLLMCLLAVGIMYLWLHEWRELDALETENRRANAFRQEVHHVYGDMTGLPLWGESVLEWGSEDFEHYHVWRMTVNSLLCRFKTVYPAERIDSVCHLLESKETLLRSIVEVLDEQENLNRRIAKRVPVIAARSTQEQSQKPKRKSFLGLFDKKEKPKPTATTVMLHSLSRKEIAQQQAQSRRLSAHADSLAMRSSELNRQLQSLIEQMDRKVQADLSPIDRALQACILSQYKRKLFTTVRQDIKPVILFKSKTISLNKEFFADFIDTIQHLSTGKLAELRSFAQGDILLAFEYFDSLHIADDNLILELQEDFSEERLLLVDGKNITSEKQQYLNTLEQPDNRFRAVFAVDMLNEGWDVLNLYDIVRLYETRDAKNRVPGKTTMQEAQLIGRGARYMPFADPSDPTLPIGKRKYDTNTNNPLRITERLHYHSANNPRYIQELRTAMTQTGIIAPKDIRVKEHLKETFKQTDLYQKGVVFCNERHEIQPLERALDGIPADIRERTYSVTMPSGQMQTAGLFGQHGAPQLLKPDHYECSFNDLGENVVRFAMDKNGNFSFSRLHTLYPQLSSIRDFIKDAKYLAHIRIAVTGAQNTIDAQTQSEKLYIAMQALQQIDPLLTKEYHQYEGTHEFKPFDFKKVFRDHELKITFSDSDREYGKSMCGTAEELSLNSVLQLDLALRNWYAYCDCFGTSEEKYLIKYIDSIYPKLQDKYAEIYLVRNELDLKLYSFREGDAFAPDFVLFMRQKDDATQSYDNLQIFIEPKGEHLLQYDKWKQDFLLSIHQLADVSLSFQSQRYNIWGVPFYTHTKTENFQAALQDIIDH